MCRAAAPAAKAAALQHDHIDVLKMDIEGGEFTVLRDILDKQLLEKLDVKLLLIEFHLREPDSHQQMIKLIDDLALRNYYLYRKELNPRDARRCAEFAFARRDFFLD